MNIKQSLDVIKKHWNSAPVPVDDIAYEIGVPTLRVNLPDNISGMIQRDGDGYKIVVNGNHARVRQRFTVAHELGHYIYHRDLLGQGTGDTRAYRAEGTEMPNEEIKPKHERQANTFAANLLMPTHLVKQLQASGLRTPAQLAAALEVSEEAMRIKLGRDQWVHDPDPDEHEDDPEWEPPQFKR